MTNHNITASCNDCGFTSTDLDLVKNHSCDIVEHGGYCEDFPACGHEAGDCNGLKYGSDASIIRDAYRQMELEDMGIFQD